MASEDISKKIESCKQKSIAVTELLERESKNIVQLEDDEEIQVIGDTEVVMKRAS